MVNLSPLWLPEILKITSHDCIVEGTFKVIGRSPEWTNLFQNTKKSCVTPRPGASVTKVSGSQVNTTAIDVYLRRSISKPEPSGFLSAVGRPERLWDNGISMNNF